MTINQAKKYLRLCFAGLDPSQLERMRKNLGKKWGVLCGRHAYLFTCDSAG